MPNIPEFLLKALYVKGSLEATANGFRFDIRNELGPVRIIGANPLKVDQKPVPLDKCFFAHGETKASFPEVSAEQSVLMRKGESLTVQVEDYPLRRGRHTVAISVNVKDMGAVRFSISDQVN